VPFDVEGGGNPSGPAPSVPTASHPLALSSGGVFAASLIVQLLGVFGSIFLYKNLLGQTGAALIGTAQFFLLIGSSINGIGDLRLGTAYTYFLARGTRPQQTTSTYLVVRTSMVGAAGLILFGILPSFVGHANVAWLGVFLALPLLWSLSTVYNQMFIGLGNSLKAQYPSLVESVVRLPVLIFVAYRMHTVEGITFAYATGAVASAAFCLPALLPRMGELRGVEARRLFQFAWPLMGSLLLNYLVTNMVPLVVNAGLGAVGLSVFLAANGWRVLALSLPLAVSTPLFPYLAGLHRKGEWEALRRVTWQALRYTAMLLVPGVVALVTYRYTFLNVFSNHLYASQGALPLAILVAGAIPLALSQILQSSINAIGRQRLELYISSAQVVVLFVTVLLILPPWGPLQIQGMPGVVAASIAVLFSSSVALALNTYFMEKLIQVHVHPASILRITASAAGAFGSFAVINRLNLSVLDSTRIFPIVSAPQLVLAVVIGFVVYFLLLALIGELTRDDLQTIGSSLGRVGGVLRLLRPVCWRQSLPELAPVDLSRAAGLVSTELPEPFTGTTELPSISEMPADAPPLPSDDDPPK
jgi:O-antigen/teichoic acid export membrane protein